MTRECNESPQVRPLSTKELGTAEDNCIRISTDPEGGCTVSRTDSEEGGRNATDV